MQEHNKSVLIDGKPDDVGMSQDQLNRVCDFLQKTVDAGEAPLVDVRVIRHGTTVCRYNRLHPKLLKGGYQISGDSLYALFSFTKPIVAILTMQQVERGTISLECPVNVYLPAFGKKGKEQVNVRHLLSHASGLAPYLLPVDFVAPIPEILEEIYKQPLIFQPGTQGSYCTWGFTVLAEILRQVTGKDLETLAQEELFVPMGLSNIHFGYEKPWKERVLPIFDSKQELHRYNDVQLLSCVRGDIGAYASLDDVAAICQMMLNGGRYNNHQLLSPVSVERMTELQFPWYDTPEILSSPPDERWGKMSKGLGWHIRGPSCYRGSDLMSERAFFHGGVAGMRAIADPKYDLITLFAATLVATQPGIPAYSGNAGKIMHTFSTMAFAAITEL